MGCPLPCVAETARRQLLAGRYLRGPVTVLTLSLVASVKQLLSSNGHDYGGLGGAEEGNGSHGRPDSSW